ncbi:MULTISPECIES: HD-GYP domain-containing protein [Bacillus]|uniref:HD-GYP domain-containing protein n=1 Tax=Bacillus TaxID=1386 RepID=UPI000BB855CC|nr:MULTISPECIES: HD domain-containing phosphohydrolase [Bacillus]
MATYNRFVKQLIFNYIFGSSIAVIGIGGVMIFTTLDLSFIEINIMAFILVISFSVMCIAELIMFKKHLQPIKSVFTSELPSYSELKEKFIYTHQFPTLTVKRILGPHFLGITLPAIILAVLFIHIGWLEMPYRYVLLATTGAMLIAGMHAFIEFFLTTKAIQTVLLHFKDLSKKHYNMSLSLEGEVLVSIKNKFLFSTLFIAIFPLMLFSLATQVRFDMMLIDANFWDWAIIILIMAIFFSFLGAYILFRDIIQPINQLIEGMENVKQGELTRSTDLYGDEFSRVISGFNSMVEGLKEQNETNQLLIESFYQTLTTTLDARDPYTAGHSLRVSKLSELIGQEIGLNEETLKQLKTSALLHDIGKIGVKDQILLKDGKLTEEEFNEIKRHPVLGAKILEQVMPKDAMAPLIPGVRSHHERLDGKGYPDKLIGDEIPLFGRIIAVADAFDAMTSDRPYRKGMSKEKALSILIEGKGSQWDPQFVNAFLKVICNEELGRKL